MRRRRNRGRTTRLSLGEFLQKAQELSGDEEFVAMLKEILPSFANRYAAGTKQIASRMGIRRSGALIDSIYGRAITFKDGDAKVGIAFLRYGIYQNLGVGRGILSTERQTGIGLTRARRERGISTSREARPFIQEAEAKYGNELQSLLETSGADFMEKLMASHLGETIRVEI